MRSIRVVLVDDEELVRTGIAMVLSTQGAFEVVGEADDGATAIEVAKRLVPDVVLMDLRMPAMDGVSATRAITADDFADPDHPIKVLVLATFTADEQVHEALRAGASGFLLKDSAPANLASAITAVADGNAYLDPAVTRGVIASITARPSMAASTGALANRLTRRELEILTLMAHGLSNGEIAARLVLAEATVKTHVCRTIMKTGARDRTQAVVLAYQNGLVVPGTAPSTSPHNR